MKRLMRNRWSILFSIVLLSVNAAGAVGALFTVLEIDNEKILFVPFLCGMVLLGLFSLAFWSVGSRAGRIILLALPAAVYLICILLFRRELTEGLGWALRSLFQQLRGRYGIRLFWNLPRDSEDILGQAAWSVLAVMAPYMLLIGHGAVRGRAGTLMLADTLWFAAACTMDEFPGYQWVVLCVLGLAAVIIRNAFFDDCRAFVQVALIGIGALGIVMAGIYRFGLPFLEQKEDVIREARYLLDEKVNEEWIPQLKSLFAGILPGSGIDVTGELFRKTGSVYTSAEIYRVTLSDSPESAVYLRGFVGKDYEGDEWKAERDAGLEGYYRRKGWALPADGSVLANLPYYAFYSSDPGTVRVEELSTPGSYTVYPYGTQLTGDYKVHWDQTAEHKHRSYELPYCAPENYQGARRLTEAEEEEEKYRCYVYDTYLEYPAGELPKLTEFLEASGFRRDSIYHSLEDVLYYLKENTVYNLDAGNTPEDRDFVEYFLFESGEGYCAHYASSAVLMLRYLGVPARYATGYAVSPEDFSSGRDGTYSAVILDSQAHAWVEVYLSGIGWSPVEMTPGAAPFYGDNTVDQMALTGKLIGQQEEYGADSEGNQSEGEPGEESADGPEKPEAKPETGEEDREKPTQSETVEQEPIEQETAAQEPQGGKEGVSGKPGGDLGKETEKAQTGQTQRPGFEKILKEHFAGAVKALKELFMVIWLPALLVITGYITRKLVLRSFRERLDRAGNREKVFLLYQNTRRALMSCGRGDSLKESGRDRAEFHRLLEKCGFGEKEPTEEELLTIRGFCEKIAEETYGTLPFYKKPLFLGADMYGLTGGHKI